jgi:hypothetical protein
MLEGGECASEPGAFAAAPASIGGILKIGIVAGFSVSGNDYGAEGTQRGAVADDDVVSRRTADSDDVPERFDAEFSLAKLGMHLDLSLGSFVFVTLSAFTRSNA